MSNSQETLDIVPIKQGVGDTFGTFAKALDRSASRLGLRGKADKKAPDSHSEAAARFAKENKQALAKIRAQRKFLRKFRNLALAAALGAAAPLTILYFSTLRGDHKVEQTRLPQTPVTFVAVGDPQATRAMLKEDSTSSNGPASLNQQGSSAPITESAIEYVAKQEVPLAPRKYLMSGTQARTSELKFRPQSRSPAAQKKKESLNLSTLESTDKGRFAAPESTIEWQGGFEYGKPDSNVEVAKSFNSYLKSVMDDPDMNSLSTATSGSGSLLESAAGK